MTTSDPSRALVRFQGDALASARGWTDLTSEERRRRAIVAAQQLDAAMLWSLTEAHTSLYGSAGAGLSARTARAYREGIGKLLQHADRTGFSLIRPERDAGSLYIRSLEVTGLSPSSIRVQLAAARALFRALRWAGATALDPFSDAKPVQDKTAPWDKRQPYTDHEVQALLKMAAPRDQALILLCAHGGLRIEEALMLTWNDVDLPAGVLTVQHGKGGKTRRVTLTRTLITALQVLPREGLVIGGTQTAARQRLQVIAKRAETRYRGWHAFRHYAGTRLVRQTGSLEYAARHLGHSSIETTRVYAKWSDQALDDALAGW
ncbi:tyrosine-type recombinase/integrase [Deinococcus aquatilis]|uniref:tyrosine-type recombinase/integrase n=1 Tax=Deinococcus aquatilis TaxID=519440 RepID=UPI000477AAFC